MKNYKIGNYLSNLNTNNKKDNEFSLWYATKCIKRPTKRTAPVKESSNVWCKNDKSKAEAFARYLQNTFQPYANPNLVTDDINACLDSSCPTDWSIKHVSPTELKEGIKKTILQRVHWLRRNKWKSNSSTTKKDYLIFNIYL